MKYRIVVEKYENEVPFNYLIQARIFPFVWLPVGGYSTLEYARQSLARLNSSIEVVESK